jgi:hypothetical protein
MAFEFLRCLERVFEERFLPFLTAAALGFHVVFECKFYRLDLDQPRRQVGVAGLFRLEFGQGL